MLWLCICCIFHKYYVSRFFHKMFHKFVHYILGSNVSRETLCSIVFSQAHRMFHVKHSMSLTPISSKPTNLKKISM